MIKLKWDKIELRIEEVVGVNCFFFRIIKKFIVYFTCFPPSKTWMTYGSVLSQWQNETAEVELSVGWL